MFMDYKDFRSDTVTKPTKSMYDAIVSAELGDDGLGDDPTVKELENRFAGILGKEDAIFVPSGTMANQVAMRIWTQPGDEVILEERSHTLIYEVGGLGLNCGVQTRPIEGTAGIMDIDEIKGRISKKTRYNPGTSLISIENTHNLSGGRILPLEYMKEVFEVAEINGIEVHLDGARVFNACVETDIDASEYAQYSHSVMVCLSKGLSCPVGSILAGDGEFIEKAVRVRQAFGGAMRQSGILAVCGLVALDEMIDRLKEDNNNAKNIADGLSEIDGIDINPEDVETNIVIFKISKENITADKIIRYMKGKGFLFLALDLKKCRIVTHKDVNYDDGIELVKEIGEIFS
jgi:threonine aldolase